MKRKNKLFKTIEDVHNVNSLLTLKWYINKYGCTQQLQEWISMSESQIMMFYKLKDMGQGYKINVSLGKKDADIFRNNPEITQEELQKICDERKDKLIVNGAKRKIKKPQEQPKKKHIMTPHEEALYKNEQLVRQYMKMAPKFCGIGLKRTKAVLERKISAGDKIAELYWRALMAEVKNISAKMAHSYENHESCYEKKTKHIRRMVVLCNELGNIVYGYQNNYNGITNKIIYFELPHMEQISFHVRIKFKGKSRGIPVYEKEWDGKVNSTLGKIERAINEVYKDELDKEVKRYKKDDKKVSE